MVSEAEWRDTGDPQSRVEVLLHSERQLGIGSGTVTGMICARLLMRIDYL